MSSETLTVSQGHADRIGHTAERIGVSARYLVCPGLQCDDGINGALSLRQGCEYFFAMSPMDNIASNLLYKEYLALNVGASAKPRYDMEGQ